MRKKLRILENESDATAVRRRGARGRLGAVWQRRKRARVARNSIKHLMCNE
jgi:hypothetical protein